MAESTIVKNTFYLSRERERAARAVLSRKEARRWVKLLASEQTSERRSEAV